MFNIFLVLAATLIHKIIAGQAGVTIDFRLDSNLFNIRKLQATTKLSYENIIELQYAADFASVAHTTEALLSADLPCQPTTYSAGEKQLLTVSTFKYICILSDIGTLDDEIQSRLR